MKRRTLDIIFSAGGGVIALLLLVFGFVMMDQASFAEGYVKDQLSDQKITFATEDALSDEEKNWKPGSSCLVEYAGELMTTGKMAECYANYFIAMHMDRAANNAGYPGETYATMGDIRSEISAELQAAKDNGADEATIKELEDKLAAATSLRGTFQTGETLRGLLLTSYGFSELGTKAELAGTVSYIAGGVMILLSAAGFVHAFVTPREKKVFTD